MGASIISKQEHAIDGVADDGLADTPLCLQPDRSYNLAESTGVGTGMFVAMLVVTWWMGFEVSWVRLLVAAVMSAAWCGYLIVRFRHAPRVLNLDSEGLDGVSASGGRIALVFDEVESADHRNEDGLRWRLVSGARELVLRDDGFSSDEWKAITMRLVAALARRGIDVSTDRLAATYHRADTARTYEPGSPWTTRRTVIVIACCLMIAVAAAWINA